MLSLIISTIAGYFASLAISHPNHPRSVKHRLPNLRLKYVEILPNIKLRFNSYEIHLHHWLILSIIYITLSIYPKDILESHLFMQGLILGGFGQGLTYPDRFKFVNKIQYESIAYIVFAYATYLNTQQYRGKRRYQLIHSS